LAAGIVTGISDAPTTHHKNKTHINKNKKGTNYIPIKQAISIIKLASFNYNKNRSTFSNKIHQAVP
jgi:hypothetical protein